MRSLRCVRGFGLALTGVVVSALLVVHGAAAIEEEWDQKDAAKLARELHGSVEQLIATAKIEDLIFDLRTRYAIAIVTHNMQQAARVSQRTAFFHLGTLVEYGPTEGIFTNPREKRTSDYITGRYG